MPLNFLLGCSQEALLEHMPDTKPTQCRRQSYLGRLGSSQTRPGERPGKALLAEKPIQRMGKGGVRESYRYFLKE
jgi:hypothetical protein